MLHADANGAPGTTTLVIQPNRCLSWYGTKLVILFFALCLITVGYYFYQLSAWLIAPFAGLELLIIGVCFYLNCLHTHKRQVIQIDAQNLSVHDGRGGGNQVCFPRVWLKVIQTQDSHGWYPSRLFIGSHGEYVEIGKYLVESERKRLADNLRCAIQGA